MTALVIGGSGSGKSAFAEEQVSRLPSGKRVYLATMRAFDGESKERVLRHRTQRAHLGFQTLEWPMDLLSAPVESESTVLLEDLPNLVANEMFGGGNAERIVPALRALAGRCGNLVIVTGDVFSDGVRYPEVTASYLRMLASINREAATLSDFVTEVVYSIPVPLKGTMPWN